MENNKDLLFLCQVSMSLLYEFSFLPEFTWIPESYEFMLKLIFRSLLTESKEGLRKQFEGVLCIQWKIEFSSFLEEILV